MGALAPSNVRSLSRAEQGLIAAALASAVFFLSHLLAFGYGRDQGIYAVVAEAMLRGGLPYRDAWDFKPPGIFFVYALARALFGFGMYAIRIVEAAGIASLLWAFAILSRRLIGRAAPGVLGGALAVVTHVQLEFWHTAQPESFAAIAMAWALVAATYEPDDASAPWRRLAAWVAAGMLYGLAGLMKPPLGGGALVSAAVVTWRYRHGTLPASSVTHVRLLPFVCLAVGGLFPVLLTVVYLWAGGALADAYQALFVFAPHYTALGWQDADLGAGVARAVWEWAVCFSVVLPAGVLLLVALPPLFEREREGWCHVGGVIAMALIGVVLQAKFFPYHYTPALALTALLAGWGWWKLVLCTRQGWLATVALSTLLVGLVAVHNGTQGLPHGFWDRCWLRVSALMNPDLRQEIRVGLHATADFDAGANSRLADWLRIETSPDAPIFIWGFEPVVYDWARRRPASRFIYNVPQMAAWSRIQSRTTLIRDLASTPPAVIVVEHEDWLPHVTGLQEDSAQALASFPALNDMLAQAYEPAQSLAHFDIYRRRSGVHP